MAPAEAAWTKWFGRYLGPHAVDQRSKTFHSFRHTFKRACREAGLSEEVHHALTGHSVVGLDVPTGANDELMARWIAALRC